MNDPNTPIGTDLSAETNTPPEITPSPASSNPPETPQGTELNDLPPEQALKLFVHNPVAFIREIVNQAAQLHLSDLREEAELRGAITAFRRNNPEFDRFEPFIMQEVVSLIQNDPDGVIDPWDTLLKKGLQLFQQKFRETVQGKPITPEAESPIPYIENAANRQAPTEPASFTREQIARMSMPEFLKHEAAINEALKEKRIR